MEIKLYNRAALNNLIVSETFRTMPVIPISKHRAISHINNPRADKADILMIIAYEGEEMVGYLGVLADTIYNQADEAFKCGWLSCMWVNPNLRGKGIAKQLLAAAFKGWNDHILVTEFTPEAKRLYDSSGNFNDLQINHGLRCYLRFNLHEILPKKSERYKPYTSMLKLADELANVPNDIRLSFFKSTKSTSVSFEEVQEIDKELNEYINAKQQYELEKRSDTALNWILKYPWLNESCPTHESKRYDFSSIAGRFKNLCFKLTDGNEIKGYLHFTIRDNHLKIPYAYCEAEYLPDIINQTYQLMKDYKLNMLTVFHKELVEYFNTNPTPFIYKRPIRRHYIISKVLDQHFTHKENITIQDGDADCAFT